MDTIEESDGDDEDEDENANHDIFTKNDKEVKKIRFWSDFENTSIQKEIRSKNKLLEWKKKDYRQDFKRCFKKAKSGEGIRKYKQPKRNVYKINNGR